MGPRLVRRALRLFGTVGTVYAFLAAAKGSLTAILGYVPRSFSGPLFDQVVTIQSAPAAPAALDSLPAMTRLYTLLAIGLVVAVVHGVLWSVAENAFGWEFGAGGGESLPTGSAAVIFSVTMTWPLLFVPLVYQQLTGTPVVPPRHSLAASIVIVFAAIAQGFFWGGVGWGHGARRWTFTGVRQVIHPWIRQPEPPNLSRHISLDFTWACVNFGSIVLPYRLLAGSQLELDDTLRKTILTGSVFFFGLTTFVLLRYPDSLIDRAWVAIRGLIAGLLLMVAMTGGMLM